jgi:flavin reductase (DIM6/NTAB) family NADH-FMN oxidoreductase RutF/DNA-binding GntR family transcriptional regulator
VSRLAGEMRRVLSPKEFREVIGHFASGVTVITTVLDGIPYGTTASAVSSLSLEPPMLLICMNRSSETGQFVAASGRFAVNILSEDQPDIAERFARKGDDKFKGVRVTDGKSGAPLLVDALATLECRVVDQVTGGTHTVFLAEVDHASARPGTPLAYFRGQFGRLELAQDEAAVCELRDRVLSRQIEVGTPLSIDELAVSLHLPRSSAYHALVRLVGEGLVTRDSAGTFVVTPLTLGAVHAGLRARCAIELGIATMTVGKVAPERVRELRALMEATRPAPDDAFKMREYVSRYSAFHEQMVRLAESPSLLDAYRRVNAPMMITRLTSHRAGEERAERKAAKGAFRHHVELVAAYEAGDLELARRTITHHMETALKFTARYMDAAGGEI